MSSKKICLLCGEMVSASETIKHRNEYKSNYGFCKRCVYDKFEREDDIRDILRMLNIPYIDTLWNDIESSDRVRSLSSYLQAIAPKRNYKNFLDSEFVKVGNKNKFVVTDEIKERWGSSYTHAEYEILELKFQNLMKIKPPSTLLEENLYRDNVLIEKRLSESLINGTSKDIETLRKLYSQDLKALGLDVVRDNESDIEALGTRIAKWEQNAPLPEMSEEFKDVDRISRYITKFFQIPFKRAAGIATKEELEVLYQDDDDIIPRADGDDADG